MPISFRFLKVNSPELLKEVFHLRYQIYCQECHFLDPEAYPNEMEIDAYDSHSIHFACLDQDDHVVGTIRLILNMDILPFPIEVHCQPMIKAMTFSRNSVAEISRLAVSKKYRRRANDNLTGMSSYFPEGASNIEDPNLIRDYRRRRPEIVLGLYRIMYHESKRLGLTHWFAAMERKLWEILNRYGIRFYQIGPEVDYYGPVIPYFSSISDLERRIYRINPGLFAYFLDGLEPELRPFMDETGIGSHQTPSHGVGEFRRLFVSSL